MKTKCLPLAPEFWQSVVSMFLRSIHRKKDGKDHRYFSIVENHRIASDKTVQRTVLYLGISLWPRKTACIAVCIARWNTSRNCFYGCARSEPICSRRNSKCCSTI